MNLRILEDWLSSTESSAKKAYEMSVARRYDEDVKELLLKIVINSSNALELVKTDGSGSSRARAVRYPGYSGGRTRETMNRDKREDTYILAYWLSKYEHNDLCPSLNQGEAFDHLAEILGIKRTSLKNYRDTFDAHTDSHRRGWVDGIFNEEQKRILRQFSNMERRKVLEIVKRTIAKYEQEPDPAV